MRNLRSVRFRLFCRQSGANRLHRQLLHDTRARISAKYFRSDRNCARVLANTSLRKQFSRSIKPRSTYANVAKLGKKELKNVQLLHTFWKTSYEWKAWQLPSRKLPQMPSGVPKLANLMDEIFCPGEHDRWALGLSGLLTFPDACI